MRIAVISDTHDNVWNLEKAIGMIREEEAEAIIHCGDFVAPFMLKRMNGAGIPVHGVLGNNDGSGFSLAQTSALLENITLSEIIGHFSDGDYNICFTHQREVAEGLACTGRYDLVCYGHTHKYRLEEAGGTPLLNPGQLMGKNDPPSFCMVDTVTSHIRQIFL